MLPAISANLPAYLLPPQTASDGRGGRAETDFGPAARVEVTGASAAADRFGSGGGLYGPNGQFVERTGGRTTDNPPHQDSSAPGRQATDAPTGGAGSEQTTGEAATTPRSEAARRAVETEPRPESDREAASSQRRQLTLKQVEAVIPPAARSELVDLAERLTRRSDTQRFDAADYKQIARLMHRVGRYVDAYQARAKAAELQNGRAPVQPADDEPESSSLAAADAESDESRPQAAE